MEGEASAFVGEEMPIQIQAQSRCQTDYDFFTTNSSSLHLLIRMRRCKEHVFGEEVIFEGKLAHSLVKCLNKESRLGLFCFIAATKTTKVHHGKRHS